MAATSVCLVICQNHSNKLERKFYIKLFWLNCCLIIKIMWCIKTARLYAATCISALFLHFQLTMWNIAIYHNAHHIAMYRDVIISWPMYRDAFCVMKFLPILTLCMWIRLRSAMVAKWRLFSSSQCVCASPGCDRVVFLLRRVARSVRQKQPNSNSKPAQNPPNRV